MEFLVNKVKLLTKQKNVESLLCYFESHSEIVGVQVNFSILFLRFASEFNEKFWIIKRKVALSMTLNW